MRLAAAHLCLSLACALLITPLHAQPRSAPPQSARVTPSPLPAPVLNVVPERFVSASLPAEELDSLATWRTPGGAVWVIATAKSSHRLLVFDGASGALLREVGGKGAAPGQFDRPNGIAVAGNHVFVVERDNHRVQVLSLPDFKPVGSFGTEPLRSPYGLWLQETEPGEWRAYVTDSFMYGKRYDQVPAWSELDQRVRMFRVQFDQDGRLRARYAGSFGDTHEATALRMVESIAGDPAYDRLLIADEDTRHLSTLREYSLSGRFTGRSLPQDSFRAQAEGIALWPCADGSGYWIAVDQLAPLTRFHLFDRATLQPRGSFEGKITAHTDGVALLAHAVPGFPHGVLYAVQDDVALAAFDLGDVARTLSLTGQCQAP
jgi:3-phytase